MASHFCNVVSVILFSRRLQGKGLSGGRGDQVWCKCNITAKDVIPWPKPPGMDHVSETTLDYLHDSREYFGDIPDSPDRPGGYHNAHP